MARQPKADHVYGVTDRFVAECLRADGSLFSPGKAIWTASNANALFMHYNEQPDTGGDSFEKKFKRQLEGADPGVIQLAAEVIYVHFLVIDDIGSDAKSRLVNEVLDWMPQPVRVPGDLAAALHRGLVGGGQAFGSQRPKQLWYLVSFAKSWKALDEAAKEKALGDPWAFKEFAWTVPIEGGYAMRNALLHLVFPDTFEDMIAREHKDTIAKTFAHLVKEPSDDVDRRLIQIREELITKTTGTGSFYDAERRHLWMPPVVDVERWNAFIEWGSRFMNTLDIDKDERTYKVELAEITSRAREALLAGNDWLGVLSSVFKSSKNNLTDWHTHSAFLEWCGANTALAERALRELWAEQPTVNSRIKAFLDVIPRTAFNNTPVPVVSFLLMGQNATRYPIYRAAAFKIAYELTEGKSVERPSRPAAVYDGALRFLDHLIRQADARGIKLRDRLDAQSLLWFVTKWDPPDAWPDEQKTALKRYRETKGMEPGLTPTHFPPPPPPPPPPISLSELAARLYVPEDFLADTVTLLRDRKQVIFYGPPGTGKTYIARELARYLAPDPERRATVQFHPSYSYEDFVHGYRPVEKDGVVSFTLEQGPLRRLARAASADPDHEYVMLIDEINRGNLPKIFGELLYLLEYREDEAILMYDRTPFRLPRNLLVIGTMNTADRSIGLIDAALRRRFHFIEFFPNEGPLEGLLEAWLQENRPEMRHVAAIVNRLNERLRGRLNRHLQLGHSYFVRTDLTEDLLSLIWKHDVMPFLEDQLFGHESELPNFELAKLRAGSADEDDLAKRTSAEDGEESDE